MKRKLRRATLTDTHDNSQSRINSELRADGDVDGNDTTFHFAYDERWRIVNLYRESDANPKEQFIYHCAGLDGMAGSSYIDTVIERDKDANSGWTSAADGTLERRDYYCHNWRGDVVTLITHDGKMVEWVKYSAYGIPYGIPRSDTNGDGTVNSADQTNVNNWWGSGVNKPTADHDLDGDVDIDDLLSVTNNWGTTLGWGKLSTGGISGSVANRKGYAGYELLPELAETKWFVRYRVFDSEQGRWIARDSFAAVNLYEYGSSSPISNIDPLGLDAYFIGFNGFLQDRDDKPVAKLWKKIATQERKKLEVFEHDELSEALAFAKSKLEYWEPDPDNPCRCRGHTLSVGGFSWGGETAIQLAHEIARLPAARDLHLGFTADPVPHGLFGILSKPGNVGRWVNFYQKVDLIIRGHPVHNADVDEPVAKSVFRAEGYKGNVFIPAYYHRYLPRLQFVTDHRDTDKNVHSANFRAEIKDVDDWEIIACPSR